MDGGKGNVINIEKDVPSSDKPRHMVNPVSFNSRLRYIEILTDFAQKQRGLEIIMTHNGASGPIEFEKTQIDAIVILRLSVDSLTGKQSSNWKKIVEQP